MALDQTKAVPVLPAWADITRRKYRSGEASIFILYGNVFDEVIQDGASMPLVQFVNEALLKPTKKAVINYDPASGVSYPKGSGSTAAQTVDALEGIEIRLIEGEAGLVVSYAGAVFPAGETNALSVQDRANVVRAHRWAMNPDLNRKDTVVFIITETLSELNRMLVGNPRIAAVQIPLPDLAARTEAIRIAKTKFDATEIDRLAAQTSGLKAVQIMRILSPQAEAGLDDAEREALIASLLKGSPNPAERAAKMADMTRGMGEDDIRKLVNPSAEPMAKTDTLAEVLDLVYQRKRELISKECEGLIDFVDATHGLEAVGGNEGIKKELLRVAGLLKKGDTRRSPMGILLVGAMGTGKTFVAKAFVKTAGLSAVVLKNFRDKWVGSTESNLEKVLSMIKVMGPVIVLIDEGDRSFGNQDGDGDGGTSSRVMARIKEFMSDTDNRGRVLFVLMTNRPDKLDVDMKRAGRFDIKVPLFYAQNGSEVSQVLLALLKRNGSDITAASLTESGVCEELVNFSNAELEALVLLGMNIATETDADAKLTIEALKAAQKDFVQSRDTTMIRYMDLQAVFEASRKSMLPPKFQSITPEQLSSELLQLKLKIAIH